ncbi:MAG: hypothetical protein HY280_00600 [Nitrospinae bacterium]|nr:hypothetical protein [Nitrospinota bacterium]
MKKGMFRWFAAVFVFYATLSLFGEARAFEVGGLASPQNFIVDAETGNYYISNVKGRAFSKGNAGFVTMLNAEGKVSKLKLIEGGRGDVTLNTPRGLLVIGDSLYVADTPFVRVFDKLTGAKKGEIDLSSLKAKFLNGLATGPDGRIFVTETVGNAIFVIHPDQKNKAELFASGKGIDSPSGIAFSPKLNKFFVTMGFSVLATVDLNGAPQKFVKMPVKSLSGVDFDAEDNVYVSSFNRGIIFKVDKNLRTTIMVRGLVSPANITLDKKKQLILVPLYLKSRAMTVPY